MRLPAIEVSHDVLEQKTIINVACDARWMTEEELKRTLDETLQRMLFGPTMNWWEEPVA